MKKQKSEYCKKPKIILIQKRNICWAKWDLKSLIKEEHQVPEFAFSERDKAIVMLHKPHPGDEMDRGSVSDLVDHLRGIGEL